MRSPSIMQTEKKCYLTGRTDNLHIHHIYGGTANRRISDANGFWVWLTGQWHNQDSRVDVHHNHELDMMLKRKCQEVYEQEHLRSEFMALIGRSYL